MTRERMSRPSSSVPNQCADDGGSRRAGRLIEAGSCGAIQGANSAKITKTMTSATPAAASGLWRALPASVLRRVMATVDMVSNLIRLGSAELDSDVDDFSLGNAANPDLAFAKPGAGDIVGRLHTHQCVHLDSKRFFDTERHFTGEIGLAVQQAGQCWAGYSQRCRGGSHRQSRRLNNLRSDEISGMGRVLHGHGLLLRF